MTPSAPSATHTTLAHEQRTLLGACARLPAHTEQRALLAETAASLTSWDGFAERAERDGMGPLAQLHLADAGVKLPEDTRRQLVGLALRHRRTSELFAAALREVLDAFDAAGIGALVLKGAALGPMVYLRSGLRPVRDCDLLVRPDDAARARALLEGLGFRIDPASEHAVEDDHYHLPAMAKSLEGLSFQIELHTRLGIRETRNSRMTFDQLFPRSQLFELAGAAARTLGMHDMLWLVYRHAFGMSVRSEPYRLIWLADLASSIDAWAAKLDWQALEREYPQLVRALPWLHFVNPWPAATLAHVPWKIPKRPARVGEDYSGWPRVRANTRGERTLLDLVRHTLLPSPWWLALRHGARPSWLGFLHAWLTHLRDLW